MIQLQPESTVTKTNKRICVVCHLYYEDLWPEIEDYLSALPPHGLDVTLSDKPIHNSDTLKNLPASAYIEQSENRGRDILPFLRMYARIRERTNYDYILKIHTKKSFHTDGFGEVWRKAMFETLMYNWQDCFKELAKPTVGMVTDSHFVLPTHITRRCSLAINKTCDALKWHEKHACFAAGSMFWVKAGVLDDLTDFALKMQWEREIDAKDGATPHIVERLFGLAVKNHGMTMAGVSSNGSDELCGEYERLYRKSVQQKLIGG